MTGRRFWWVLAVFVVVVFAYAWLDGGEEPLHDISQPVAVPGGK
jgi:hypothetical protein